MPTVDLKPGEGSYLNRWWEYAAGVLGRAVTLTDGSGVEITTLSVDASGSTVYRPPGTDNPPGYESYTEAMEVCASIAVPTQGGEVTTTLHPHRVTESLPIKSSTVATLTGTHTDIMQVFQSSSTSIHAAQFTLGVSGVASFAETFESYADSAALAAVWVSSDAANTTVTLDTAVFHSGTQSMDIRVKKDAAGSVGDTVTITLGAAEDWSTMESGTFWIRSDQDPGEASLAITITDNAAGTATVAFSLGAKNTWTQVVIPFADFIGTLNKTVVLTLSIDIVGCTKDAHLNIDGMLGSGTPGTVDVELYEVASATPSAFGSQVGTAVTIELQNADPHTYEVEFDATTTVGQHYALVATNRSIVGATIAWKGSAAGGYVNGGAFTSDDNGANLTAVAGEDFSFAIWSHAAAVIRGLCLEHVGVPDSGNVEIGVITSANLMQQKLVHERSLNNREDLDFGAMVRDMPVVIEAEGSLKGQITYTGSPTATRGSLCAVLAFAPHSSNG